MVSPRSRTRLSPDARRQQLLDTTQALLISKGLQSFTMEGLAKAAAVSAPLVYNYFANRTELLQALLKREYQRFVEEFSSLARDAQDFEEIVRISVTTNFDHQAPGHVLPLLLSQPEISDCLKVERRRHSRQNGRFLVRAAAEQYQLSPRQAGLVVSMSSGASIAAAELAASASLDRNEAMELAVAYILAGIERIASL